MRKKMVLNVFRFADSQQVDRCLTEDPALARTAAALALTGPRSSSKAGNPNALPEVCDALAHRTIMDILGTA